ATPAHPPPTVASGRRDKRRRSWATVDRSGRFGFCQFRGPAALACVPSEGAFPLQCQRATILSPSMRCIIMLVVALQVIGCCSMRPNVEQVKGWAAAERPAESDQAA